MNTSILIATYIEIETKEFNKFQKNKKMEELFLMVKESEFTPTEKETIDLIHFFSEKNICIRQPLFKNIIYPILKTGIENNKLEAIKAILKLERQLTSYQAYSKDYTITFWGLLEKALALAPMDKEILSLYHQKMKAYLLHTLHEIPLGVLYGNDGASIEECDILLKEVDIYESVCQKLNLIEEKALIAECRYYYLAYKNYLPVYPQYGNFETFLKLHSSQNSNI